MNWLTFSALIVFAASSAGAQTIESAFTDFHLKKCRHTPGKVEEDYGEWRCKGYANIPIYMTAGDQRVMISFGPRADKEPAARQTLASFNGEGKRIEWRIDKISGKAFATIMRWSTTKPGDNGDPIPGEMMVVTRLPPGAVCHVGYVDGLANKSADELAREIADKQARAFRCGQDKPVVLGEKGLGFSELYDFNEN